MVIVMVRVRVRVRNRVMVRIRVIYLLIFRDLQGSWGGTTVRQDYAMMMMMMMICSWVLWSSVRARYLLHATNT